MAHEQPYHQHHQYGPREIEFGRENWAAHASAALPPAENREWGFSLHRGPEPWDQPHSEPPTHSTSHTYHGPSYQQSLTASATLTAKTPLSEHSLNDGGSSIQLYPLYSTPALLPLPSQQQPSDKICGVRKELCAVFLAIAVFLAVAAVSTGLGVGLALRKSSTASAVAMSPTSTSASISSSPSTTAPTRTKTISTTTTKVSPTPAFTGAVIDSTIVCPRDNGSVYISAIISKPFSLECGLDYNSEGGTKDLSHQATGSMNKCIDLCGSESSCVGVGWGVYQGTPTCWLKSALGEPNDSPGWFFAKLQNLNQTSAQSKH